MSVRVGAPGSEAIEFVCTRVPVHIHFVFVCPCDFPGSECLCVARTSADSSRASMSCFLHVFVCVLVSVTVKMSTPLYAPRPL